MIGNSDPRLRIMWVLFLLVGLVLAVRLFILMVFQHNFYLAMAAGSHEIYNDLFAKRGEIFIQDSRTGEEYPLAMNRDYFLVFADTRQIKSNDEAEAVAQKLAEFFSYNDEKKLQVHQSLNKRTDPYEPIENRIDEATADRLRSLALPGIDMIRKPARFYPEGSLASAVVGFVGKDGSGHETGRYGIEGYWDRELAGKGGFVQGAKSAVGAIIPLAGFSFSPAEDGADILLTIDRTLQYTVCTQLEKYREEYGAVSASLIALDPGTGAIRAMCSLPDFDPNHYGEVESIGVYNNSTVFTPYEPGSIFKPITMAAALNEGQITPQSTFVDLGARAGICDKPIKNAAEKVYGQQTMTGVLENSINTGMVYVVEKLGKKKLAEYVESFGFGTKEGIELNSEVSGNINTLYENKKDKIDCYAATASFGQGITATPLQMVAAYGVLANGGKLLKPYIVDEIRYTDGRIEKTKPREIRQVIDSRAAMLLRGMLISVVDNGHSKTAQVKGYYIGGKTGTAQIPGLGGYTSETIQSFIGLVPADNPKLVVMVKFEKPRAAWAESTAVPAFSSIAKFALQYYQIAPVR